MSTTPQCKLSDLQPDRFLFKSDVLPSINFRLISAPIPGINITNTRVGAKSPQMFSVPGYGIEFSPLSMVFVVDEDLNNWLEAVQWVKRVTQSDDITQEGVMGLASLVVLDSDYKSALECQFQDCVPVNVGDIDLTVNEETTYITTTMTIEFSQYRLKGKNFETEWL